MLHAVRRDRLMERFGNAHDSLAQAAVADVAARHEASSAQVALSWMLHNPAVSAAVIGVHSVAQLNELVQATSLSLSASDLDQLDRATIVEEVRVARATGRTPRPGRVGAQLTSLARMAGAGQPANRFAYFPFRSMLTADPVVTLMNRHSNPPL